MAPESKPHGSETAVYLQAYFVTIATILGTGILGLPVTLSDSGLYPFLITFIIDALIQSLSVHLFVDLLQRAISAQHLGQGNAEESFPLNSMLEEDMDLESDEDDDDGPSNGAIMKGRMQHIREIPLVQPPNLHLMGRLFLGCGLGQCFDAMLLVQFIALLICYALAGSEAFAQLLGINYYYIIPVFVTVLTTAIVFALQLIQPVVSVLTFLKGSLLLGTTFVTFYVGLTVAQEVSNDFSHIGGPFLMGTVALGGVVNTMPYTFEKVPYKKKQIGNYRLAVQLGLWTCVLLNIMWCWAVLDIVPQTIEMACASHEFVSSLKPNFSGPGVTTITCKGDLSLERAADKGEISTLPLTKLLQRDHPKYTWVAVLVEVFIMVSITVSYLTIGSALHHTLKGIVASQMQNKKRNNRNKQSKSSATKWFASTGVSLGAFTVVFAVAMLNPEGFVIILEKLVSFAINIEVGLFVSLMILISRRSKYKDLEVPLPLGRWVVYLAVLLPLFFNFAVFYDVYSSVMMLVSPGDHPGVVMNITISGLNSSETNADAEFKELLTTSAISTAVPSIKSSAAPNITSTLLSSVIQSLNGSVAAGVSASSLGNSTFLPSPNR
ncbi:hypothetical protein RRG08_049871 [Elysia crispata]|uniref:Amino acid transporter transmembrane domain-containing protein n=1 Tax=Elysia crispata TaxID=231223 RepID=A0AAE1CPQ2_9GAST|nr:hypothetical protein RRG08_049871 [Elysia crispata]